MMFLQSGWQRKAAAEVYDLEAAILRLKLVTPHRLALRVADELERRKALFVAALAESPLPALTSPERSACDSVYDDIVTGRLR